MRKPSHYYCGLIWHCWMSACLLRSIVYRDVLNKYQMMFSSIQRCCEDLSNITSSSWLNKFANQREYRQRLEDVQGQLRAAREHFVVCGHLNSKGIILTKEWWMIDLHSFSHWDKPGRGQDSNGEVRESRAGDWWRRAQCPVYNTPFYSFFLFFFCLCSWQGILRLL